MSAATCQAVLPVRRSHSEKPGPLARAKKLRVVQLGWYPSPNRGARAHLFSIHDRLLSRGHESMIVDLTPHQRVRQPGVVYPRTIGQLKRILTENPADLMHLQFGSPLTWRKLALGAFVAKLPATKKVCTLHLGGQTTPQKTLRASPWGATAMLFRHFDGLIAINPEIAAFYQHLGIPSNRLHVITPFPRLRVAESVSLSDEIEAFCRQHTPLIASAGEFEPGYDLPKQFDILSKVRERYPSAGLLAIGSGNLHFEFMYQRALHQDCNHIELTGTLSEAAAAELLQRANVVLRPTPFNVDAEIAALQVLRNLQVARTHYEDTSAALTDGVDDIIRLYKQLATPLQEAAPQPLPLQAAYESANIGWGL